MIFGILHVPALDGFVLEDLFEELSTELLVVQLILGLTGGMFKQHTAGKLDVLRNAVLNLLFW